MFSETKKHCTLIGVGLIVRYLMVWLMGGAWVVFGAEPCRIQISVADRHHHLLQISQSFPPGFGEKPRVFRTPSPWHFLGLSVSNADGTSLNWSFDQARAMTVRAPADTAVKIDYTLVLPSRAVGWSCLNHEYGVLVADSIFLQEAEMDAAVEIRFSMPDGWSATSSLGSVSTQAMTFSSWPSIQRHPIFIGKARVLTWSVRDVPHRLLLFGDLFPDENLVMTGLESAFSSLSESWGQSPFHAFMIALTPSRGVSMRFSPLQQTLWVDLSNRTFAHPEEFRNFLTRTARAYGECWARATVDVNAESEESVMRQDWFLQGWLGYAALQACARATPGGPCDLKAEMEFQLNTWSSQPVGSTWSVDQGSSWRSGEDMREFCVTAPMTRQGRIPFHQGLLMALAMDLLLRHHTQGALGVVDVINAVIATLPGKALTRWESLVRQQLRDFDQADLTRQFDAFLLEPNQIPFERLLDHAGMNLTLQGSNGDAQDERPRSPYLGLSVSETRGGLRVMGLTVGSPAWQSGLDCDDEILAVNAMRTDHRHWSQLLNRLLPGDLLHLLVNRDGEVITLNLQVGSMPPNVVLSASEEPTVEQQICRRAVFSKRPPRFSPAKAPEQNSPE